MGLTTIDGQASCEFSLPNDDGISKISGYVSLHDSIPWDKNGFVVAPFDKSEKIIFIDPDNEGPRESIPFKEGHHQVSREEYIRTIEAAIKKINSDNLEKVVLSRMIERESIRPTDRSRFFHALTQRYPDAFCYHLQLNDRSAWVGATPEKLIQYENGVVRIDALAGTLPISDSPQWTQKEYQEQQIVTQYVVDLLESIGANQIKTDGPKTKPAGQICHLQTIITAKADQSSVDILINKLHPTPAVCGTPKENAYAFIRENESHDRKLYTGYLGVIENGALELFVNLRCMELLNDRSLIYVGGGITAESDPDSEWNETELKSQTMGTVLQNLHYI